MDCAEIVLRDISLVSETKRASWINARYVSKITGKIIECFHSRGQHIRKFIVTKESVYIRKEFNSQGTGLGHQYGRRDVM